MEAALTARDVPVVAAAAVPLADLAQHEGDPALSAEVLGIAGGLQGMDDAGNPEVRRLLATAAAELGEERFRERYDAGFALPRARALRRLAELLEVTGGLEPWVQGAEPDWLRKAHPADGD
jgi:hypothetical protein